MKRTMDFLRVLMAVLVIAAFASCEKPENKTDNTDKTEQNPDNGEDNGENNGDNGDGTQTQDGYPTEANTYVVNGVESSVASAFAFSMSGYVAVIGSPVADATLESIFSETYIYAAVLPEQLNTELDILESGVNLVAYDSETETQLVFDAETVESGVLTLKYDEATRECTLLVFATMLDGTKVGANVSATLPEESTVQESGTIAFNKETEPVRAAYYMYDEASGRVYLYFTSAETTHFEDMTENAFEYFYIMMYTDYANGNEIDITDADAASKWAMTGYMNNLSGTGDYVDPSDTDGYSGTFSVAIAGDDPTHFTVSAALTFGETTVDLSFDGNAVSVDYVPESNNEFTYGGETTELRSALVYKDGTTWHVYLSRYGGMTEVRDYDESDIHITAPSECFDGDPYGFSSYKDDSLMFEYGGTIWSYTAGNVGTFTATLSGSDLEVEFTDYNGFSGYFKGTATIVE